MEFLRSTSVDFRDLKGINLTGLRLLNFAAILGLGLTLGCLREPQIYQDDAVSLAVCPNSDQVAQNRWTLYQVVTHFGTEQCILLSKDGKDILIEYIPQSQMDPDFTLSFESKGKTIPREDF